jgi:hypothetical protein
MENETKPSKYKLNRLAEIKLKERREQEKREEKASIEASAREFSDLIKDKRYKAQKIMLEARLNANLELRSRLKSTVKSNDEYVRRGIECDTEISLIRDILDLPEVFVKRLNELLEENKEKKQ